MWFPYVVPLRTPIGRRATTYTCSNQNFQVQTLRDEKQNKFTTFRVIGRRRRRTHQYLDRSSCISFLVGPFVYIESPLSTLGHKGRGTVVPIVIAETERQAWFM